MFKIRKFMLSLLTEGFYLMPKFNILKRIYKRAPMNFYTRTYGSAIIKSINNTFLGYKFDREFTDEDISTVWDNIKFHKRFSTISIFIFFIILLYSIIFPNYAALSGLKWYYTVLPMLVIIFLIYQGITFINTKWFEKRLENKFGSFEKTIFNPSDYVDEKYYHLFKIELAKALTLLLVLALCFCAGSPFKIAMNMIAKEKYKDAIKLTTIGSRIFPIAPEWYSLRGYSRFHVEDYEGAIRDYDRAYKLGLDNFNVMNFDNKIFVKFYTKQFHSAIKDFDREIENAQSDYEKDSFLWDKAQFLYNIKEYKEALKIYNELLVKSEQDRIFLLQNRLYFERAEVYKKLGLDDLAAEDMEKADTMSIEEAFKNPIPQPTLLLEDI